jgi:hypothetical protein
MEVLQVKKFNALQDIKYSKACQEWKFGNGGFPQAVFYFSCTNWGQFRRTGYVAFDYRANVWRKTKREAIEAFNFRGSSTV